MRTQIKKVIGINIGHDGGCTLVVNGEIVATMAEERLNRVKNSYGWLNSLKYCLEKGEISLQEIDLFVFSDYNDKIASGFTGGLNLFGIDPSKCIIVDHHLSHACTAFLTSGYKKSLVYVLDGRGNNNSTETFYTAEGNKIEKIAGNPQHDYKKGLVAAYQAFTSYFGWHQDEAGKTMGLAPYGNPDAFSKLNLFEETKEGWFVNKLEDNTALAVERFFKEVQVEIPAKFAKDPMIYVDMGAWLQKEFEKTSLKLINKVFKDSNIDTLCMAGGGALNSVMNRKILQETAVKHLHIFPAAGDSGQSIGNALYGYYIFGNQDAEKRPVWNNDYRKVINDKSSLVSMLERTSQIVELIIPKSSRYKYSRQNNIAQKTAQLISQGNIVGWFQAGSEIGPRSLGHRSILCDPRSSTMKDDLNLRVKHRESFRPFAASVLLEKAKEYFDIDIPTPFMLLVVNVLKDKRKNIPAVTHIDNTCRIQTVTREDNGIFYNLIEEFNAITKIPMILNTSFNLANEPIVETPFEALRCFLRTEMDYLVIEDYLIEKVKG